MTSRFFAGCLMGALLFGCRAPTQITVLVRTDVDCRELDGTTIRVGTLGGVGDGKAVVDSPRCVDGRIGTLVVVPSGSRDAEVAVQVTVGLGKTSAADCDAGGFRGDCIVARRALTFVEHSELDLPIDLRFDCRDVPCDAAHTCVHGTCVDARIGDARQCHGNACSDEVLFGGGGDAGATDSTVATDATDSTVATDATDADIGADADGGADSLVDVTDADGDAAEAGRLGVTKLVAKSDSRCVLLTDQTVWCWGANGAGQLGDGTISASRSTPAPVLVAPFGAKLTRVTDIAMGGTHACALLSDDTVVCWGDGSNGELGNGVASATPLPSPTKVLVTAGGAALHGVKSLAAGNRDTCALMSDSSILCWGNFGATLDPQPPPGGPLTGATQLSLGGDHACVRLSDGTARCWGYNGDGEIGDGTTTSPRTNPTPVLVSLGGAVLGGVGALSGGMFFTCAHMSDDTAKCWGGNGTGAIGDGVGAGGNALSPTSVLASAGGASLSGVKAVAAGGAHGCALFGDATVACWGRNGDGEVGTGVSGTIELSPTKALVSSGGAPLASVVELAAGGYSTCVRTADEAVYCWGLNNLGQVGDGTAATPKPSPVRVLLP